jgi:beta-lactam-binding protein with PASTA domain
MRPIRSRLLPIIAVLAMAVPFLGPTGALALQDRSTTSDVQGTRVPPLVDRRFAEVGRLLELARLRVGRVDSVFGQVARGIILRQSPRAGSSVAAGSAVDVVYSRGQATTDDVGPLPGGGTFDGEPPVVDSVAVPDLSGSSKLQAILTLMFGKLGVGPTHVVPDSQHAGQVFRQSPAAGARVPKATQVEFWYGADLTVAVPDVKDSSLAAATRVLEDSGLKVGKVDDPAHSNHTGPVVKQSPKAGAVVTLGRSIRLSLGPPPYAKVPSVVGQPLQAANAALTNAGLTSGAVENVPSDRPAGTVLTQNPQAEDSALRGSAVALGVAILRPDTLTVAVAPPPIRRPRVIGSTEAGATAARDLASAGSFTIPDLIGKRAASAESLLARARLPVVSVDSAVGFGPGGFVLRQEPPPGTLVLGTTMVRLWVGRGRDIPWLLVAGAVVVLIGLGALTIPRSPLLTTAPSSPGAVPPALWLEPHVVAGEHSIGTDAGPVASHELQLTPHAGAATQGVDGDETFTRELP